MAFTCACIFSNQKATLSPAHPAICCPAWPCFIDVIKFHKQGVCIEGSISRGYLLLLVQQPNHLSICHDGLFAQRSILAALAVWFIPLKLVCRLSCLHIQIFIASLVLLKSQMQRSLKLSRAGCLP